MARGINNLRNRRPGRGAAPWHKVIAAFAIVAVVIGMAGIFWKYRSEVNEAKMRDPETYCRTDIPIQKFVVLVDRTDNLSAVQRLALSEGLVSIAEGVPVDSAFILYEVGGPAPDGVLVPNAGAICNPGTGDDANVFVENPKKMQEKYEEKYTARITALKNEMQNDRELNKSPIMEAIQAIAVREFSNNSHEAGSRLYIYSDLLQHSENLSLYAGTPELEIFLDSAVGRSLYSNLNGVAVEFRLFFRASANEIQDEQFQKFWMGWIKRSGGFVAHWLPLPG